MPVEVITTRYQVPEVLRDLWLIDMLELNGSTLAAARSLNLSQPTVSRRYRAVAQELGLNRSRSQEPGCRFGNSDCLRLLRKGANLHRWQSGVMRVGALSDHMQAQTAPTWIQWIELSSIPRNHWKNLFRHELLDAVALPIGEDLDTFVQALNLNMSATAISGLQLLYRRHPRIVQLLKPHQN